RYLAPSLDLDPSLPSFVKVGLPTLLLCATLLAVLALAWWRGKRGLLAGGAAYGLLGGGLWDTPLLDARLSTLLLLEAWDPARIRGCSGPLELGRLRVPIELRGAPWLLREGLLFNSRRLGLPPGLYRLEVDGRTLEAPPRSKTVRVDLTAGELLLERVYLEQAR